MMLALPKIRLIISFLPHTSPSCILLLIALSLFCNMFSRQTDNSNVFTYLSCHPPIFEFVCESWAIYYFSDRLRLINVQ